MKTAVILLGPAQDGDMDFLLLAGRLVTHAFHWTMSLELLLSDPNQSREREKERGSFSLSLILVAFPFQQSVLTDFVCLFCFL